MNLINEESVNLYETIKKLRSPEGCPWDREQTPLSMRGDLMEETFEAIEAITDNDIPHVKEELGDVLLNTLMIAYMHEENGDFLVSDCFKDVNEKIIRRHPHVFPQSEGKSLEIEGGARNSQEVLAQWDKIKSDLEGRKSSESILDEVSKGIPPLLRSYKLQKKASKKGFDWNSWKEFLPKIQEELSEVIEAKSLVDKNESEENQLNLEAEIGDLLFSVVNLARLLKVNPELALSRTNEKFRNRFYFIEKEMAKKGLELSKENLDEMEKYWTQSKNYMD